MPFTNELIYPPISQTRSKQTITIERVTTCLHPPKPFIDTDDGVIIESHPSQLHNYILSQGYNFFVMATKYITFNLRIASNWP